MSVTEQQQYPYIDLHCTDTKPIGTAIVQYLLCSAEDSVNLRVNVKVNYDFKVLLILYDLVYQVFVY